MYKLASCKTEKPGLNFSKFSVFVFDQHSQVSKLRKFKSSKVEIQLPSVYTVGILQYKPIQLAKYYNLIGQLRATELDYIVKYPQC